MVSVADDGKYAKQQARGEDDAASNATKAAMAAKADAKKRGGTTSCTVLAAGANKQTGNKKRKRNTEPASTSAGMHSGNSTPTVETNTADTFPDAARERRTKRPRVASASSLTPACRTFNYST